MSFLEEGSLGTNGGISAGAGDGCCSLDGRDRERCCGSSPDGRLEPLLLLLLLPFDWSPEGLRSCGYLICGMTGGASGDMLNGSFVSWLV